MQKSVGKRYKRVGSLGCPVCELYKPAKPFCTLFLENSSCSKNGKAPHQLTMVVNPGEGVKLEAEMVFNSFEMFS